MSRGPGELIGPAFTEVAGDLASSNQLARQHGRYMWVRGYSQDARVLEVACGSGQGLGLLAGVARSVVGADYSPENLAIAARTYGNRVPLVRLDAHALPLRTASLDVVLMLETLYFLPSPSDFVAEAARVLRPGGRLLLSVINKDHWDYQQNRRYPFAFGAVELRDLLATEGFATRCFGAMRMDHPTARQRLFTPLKRMAARFGLIPEAKAVRVWLKRLVFGGLVPLPRELTPQAAEYTPPVPVPDREPDTVHQVLFCEGLRSA